MAYRQIGAAGRVLRAFPLVFYAVFSLGVLAACADRPMRPSYRPLLPELPARWAEILGEPHWRFEWVGAGGSWQERETPPGQGSPELSLAQEWAVPVLAWPFWPARGLFPGAMRPAGAVFPRDAGKGTLPLSWERGVDALFWKELAAADHAPAGADGRLPWYFDWPRFRELLESGNIPEAVRLDPWLADWKGIARKTVQSGFDRRRFVPRKSTVTAVPAADGPWIGSSPFAPALEAEHGILRLSVTDTPDTWVSSAGFLRCSVSGWVFRGAAN